ncbi:TatD family hydrolase [Zooshikella ganghwensis]|uniref:TatD family deoxyribonuclease n=1 Tax=Zooshikella ganghwensis TaxID=202772 RepID=A0A4P9VLT1_9GAMM|nr:TatD family hydrolase [Zooshikella ganghwensis]RDH44325.1 TatD family deoxyribonuclease [Zooshikella ganghwensis]
MLVDSHCHLDRLKLDAYDNNLSMALQAAEQEGVSHFLTIAVSMENSPQVVSIAEQYPNVFATVGVHPLEQDGQEPDADKLVALSDHPKVVAIGEMGLDYYYAKETVRQQQQRFVTQLQVAQQVNKPVVIHTREAKADTLALLRSHSVESFGGVLHCFTEDWDMARQALDLGMYISISGIVTFRQADNVREVAQKIPLDRLLVETDAPYLAPVPFRGKTNEPKYVSAVASFLAELRGESLATLAEQTSANFFRLFSSAKA